MKGCKIENYVNKIIQFSKIIAIHENGILKGFISYYKNDPNKNIAFLSMLIISKEFQSDGEGSFLLKTAIDDLKKNLFAVFKLEVLKENKKAITLYTKFGFEITQENKELLLMELELRL